MFTLLGPSGCGKTTTLRCIAGLETAEAGEIRIDGKVVFAPASRHLNVPPNRRDIGMVFQSYAIWPHMTVFENVAFPLRVARPRVSRAEIEQRVDGGARDGGARRLRRPRRDAALRRPAAASGAGARLVREPKLLLLDEPLSNLDAKLREEMRFELKRLQSEIGITAIYVTHDQVEALALSDQIAVMNDGQIQQLGTPREIYERPANRFVAGFIGSTNFLNGQVTRIEETGGAVLVDTPLGEVRAAGGHPGTQKNVVVAVRPEHVRLSRERPPGGSNVFQAKVLNALYLGESIDTEITINGAVLRARGHPDLELTIGDTVCVQLPAERCVVLRST